MGLYERDVSKQDEYEIVTSAARWILPDIVNPDPQTLDIGVSRARWTINNLQM